MGREGYPVRSWRRRFPGIEVYAAAEAEGEQEAPE